MKKYFFCSFIAFSITFTFGNLIIEKYAKYDLYTCLLVHSSDKTNELYHHLMSNYNKNVRPVRNNSDVVTVKLGLKLIQIADVVCIYCI